MPTPFWKSEEAIERLSRLDRPGFAAEFLKRNPDFQRDCRETQRRIAEGQVDAETALTELARRWGLRFRPGSGGPGGRRHLLAAGGLSGNRDLGADTRGLSFHPVPRPRGFGTRCCGSV